MPIFDFILHLDKYLVTIIDLFGVSTYIILFLVIFAETGLVVTPFLPGDSLLFIIGTLSGNGLLDIRIAYPILLAAAILGDTVNYWIGHRLGEKVFTQEKFKFIKKEHLERTREFYAKHGGKTIILARFVPIVRTFAPFVAGIGKMNYPTFLFYNVIGGFAWVTSMTFAGYFFGGLPIIKDNFEYAVIGIVLVSLIPVGLEYLKTNKGSKKAKSATLKDLHQSVNK